MQTVYLKRNEERRIAAGHLWIFSNEIDTEKSPLKNFSSGELVKVASSGNKNLGIGYINPHVLLAVRLLDLDAGAKIDSGFFCARLQSACQLRKLCFNKPFYRLVFSEGDYLPGLIADRFDDVLVVQLTTAGMENLKGFILDALIKTFGPKAILLRNDVPVRSVEGLPQEVEIAYGKLIEDVELLENGCKFRVPVFSGQKTGWFYDQRQNRRLFAKYVQNRRVLDLFSYAGGFGIQAAVHGAKETYCLDISKKALEYAKDNAELNNTADKMHFIEADAVEALKELLRNKETFDAIILDPPAFVKKRKDLLLGSKAYQNLLELALQLLPRHGILSATSCSMHITRDLFLGILRKAGLRAKKKLRIIAQLHQSADHPVHPAITETDYLKGFIVEADHR